MGVAQGLSFDFIAGHRRQDACSQGVGEFNQIIAGNGYPGEEVKAKVGRSGNQLQRFFEVCDAIFNQIGIRMGEFTNLERYVVYDDAPVENYPQITLSHAFGKIGAHQAVGGAVGTGIVIDSDLLGFYQVNDFGGIKVSLVEV